MSVWENVCFARCTRNSPSAPLSSRPGVSMSTTGPMGSSSIAFSTVSVVVPRMSETHGHLLSGDGIDKAGLAGVASAKESDVNAVGTGCLIAILFHALSP